MKADTIKEKLLALIKPEKALVVSSFLLTKQGQYAYGDIFLGVTVPQIRKIITPYGLCL